MNPVHSKFAVAQARASGRSDDYSQLALWMTAGLAGMVSAMILARAPFFRKMLLRLGQKRRRPRKPSRRRSLPMLAQAILGSSRSSIKAVFGPPRSATVEGVGVVVHPQHVYWQSDTWYYPLNRNGPMALAIQFIDDLATKVEFFTAPQIQPGA